MDVQFFDNPGWRVPPGLVPWSSPTPRLAGGNPP